MNDHRKTKDELILELKVLRQQLKDRSEEEKQQQRALHALQICEARSCDLLDGIEDGFYEVDLRGNFTLFNRAVCRILGYPPSILGGLNFREIMDRKNAGEVQNTFSQVFQSGKPARAFDWEIVRRDGSARTIEASVSLVRDPLGKPMGFRGIARDITERRLMVDLLKESESKYRLISENTSDLISIVTFTMRPQYVYVSPSHWTVLGYHPDDLQGKSALQLIHPDDKRHLVPLLGKYVKAKKDLLASDYKGELKENLQFRVKDRDGRWHYVESTANLVEDRLLFISKDVTERIMTQKALKESEYQMSRLMEGAPDPIVVLDEQGKVLTVNPAAERMTGYRADRLVGKHFTRTKILDRESVVRATREFEMMIRGKHRPPFELEILSKNGARLSYELNARRIKRTGGKQGIQVILRDITDRKVMEKALKEGEARYRSLYEEVPAGVYRSTPDGKLLSANPALVKMLGYKSEKELCWKNIREDLYADPGARDGIIGKIKKRGKFRNVELHLRRKDGRTLVVLDNARAITDENGSVKYYEGTLTDITERKFALDALKQAKKNLQRKVSDKTRELRLANRKLKKELQKREKAESALKESEVKFRGIFEESRDAIYITSPDGRIQDVNRAALEMFGLKKKDLATYNTIDYYVDPEQYSRFRKTIEKKGFVRDYEVRFKNMKGEELICLETASLRHAPDGTILGYQGIIRDVTARKRMEENLLLRQTAFQALYEIAIRSEKSFQEVCDQSVMNLAGLLNAAHVNVQVLDDTQAYILSGISNNQISGRDSFPMGNSPFEAVIKHKKTLSLTGNLNKRFQGNPFMDQREVRTYVGTPIFGEEKILGVLSVMDSRDRSFSEHEIHLIEIFAAYIAHEHERELMEARLLQSQERELLGNLTAGVAHEVRNPLNAILALVEAISMGMPEDTEDRVILDQIRVQVDRLSSLMRDLLDLGKPIQKSNLVRLAVTDVCRQSVTLWKETHRDEERPIHLVYPPEAKEMTVMADASKLQQVIINLLDNAANHSPEKSPILFEIQKLHGPNIRLRFTDQGTGVPPEKLDRIFDPFFTTRKGGTGLGLSLVRQIVEKLDGNIVIWNNDPPPGCTIEIRLPLAPQLV